MVAPAALIAAPESRLLALRTEALAQPLGILFVCTAARARMERRLEAAPEDRLVRAEVAAVNRVLGLLPVAQPDPPTLTRRVHALDPDLFEEVARNPFAHVVVGYDQHD